MTKVGGRSRLIPTGYCWCGCGGETARPGSFFLQGHDRFAESALIKLKYGDVAHFLFEEGYGPDGKNVRKEIELGLGVRAFLRQRRPAPET